MTLKYINMAKLQNFIVVLLVLTIVLSAVSVVFNLIIYKILRILSSVQSEPLWGE